ncbi:hypothetical protein E3O06_00330 [Cryobacterium glaciale]|uniref:Uncharacterized protein n=1 Tax=Cryobacterium glaciale TaxID=1259145 RepID=A0A4R8V719_9MICO|nr:hypothetical protein [Cryobacterium glaciale]TFB77246.1 hypothetical protein E3O06_00330 [Cryobacterium glaciale]
MSSATDRASNLLDMGQNRQAAILLETHIATSPTDAAALGLLARALTATDRHADGAAAALRAVRLEPTDAYLLVLYAHCMVNASQYDNAISAAEQAIRLNPSLLWAHETLARAHAGLANFEAAADAVDAAQLLAEPNNDAQAAMHSLRSSVLAGWPKRFGESIEQAQLAVRRAPQNDWYRTRLAQLQFIDHKPWLALRTATDVLTSAPTTDGARGTLLSALHLLQRRMLGAQFATAALTAVLGIFVFSSSANATRLVSLLSLALTAAAVLLLLRGAPLGGRLVRSLGNTMRTFRGSVVAGALQALIVLLSLATLVTGSDWPITIGWLLIVAAGIAFETSGKAMVEAASRAYGRSEAEVFWDARGW